MRQPGRGYPPRQSARPTAGPVAIVAACGAALELRRMPR